MDSVARWTEDGAGGHKDKQRVGLLFPMLCQLYHQLIKTADTLLISFYFLSVYPSIYSFICLSIFFDILFAFSIYNRFTVCLGYKIMNRERESDKTG